MPENERADLVSAIVHNEQPSFTLDRVVEAKKTIRECAWRANNGAEIVRSSVGWFSLGTTSTMVRYLSSTDIVRIVGLLISRFISPETSPLIVKGAAKHITLTTSFAIFLCTPCFQRETDFWTDQ